MRRVRWHAAVDVPSDPGEVECRILVRADTVPDLPSDYAGRQVNGTDSGMRSIRVMCSILDG